MATLSLPPFPPSSSSSSFPSKTSISRSISSTQSLKPTSPNPISIKPTFRKSIIVKATKEEDPPLPDTPAAATTTSESESESESLTSPPKEPAQQVELSELGAEIKKAMQEREKKDGGGEKDFWSGVAEEIGEIEWPAFGKVLGTTGVVMGVIAGSSVVLLTVNGVLAELSDKVFAGRGVQDFFG